MKIHIVTDSTSDIPQEVLHDLPISVLPLYITLNGKSYLDNVDLSREDFYKRLPQSDPYPTTAAPAPNQFKQAYDAAVDQGAEAILSIHISKSLSAIVQSAETAAKDYDRVPVQVIDSGNLSMAEGLVVIKAAQAAKADQSLQKVLALVDDVILRTHAFAKLDTIDYLHKGGRMSSIQHSLVSLLGIKPILKMNNHHSRMEIARTKSKAFEKVLHTALEAVPHAELFGITHADVPEQAQELADQLREAFPQMAPPLMAEVTPALGVHVGPGALCVNWVYRADYHETEKTVLQRWFRG